MFSIKECLARIGSLGSILFILLLAGCVTSYKEPEKNAPSSQLVLMADNAGPSAHEFMMFSDYNCSAGSGSGRLAYFTWTTPTKVSTVRVAAGNRIFIRALYQDYPAGGGPGVLVKIARCTNLVSFVPENGSIYEVSQTSSYTQCKVTIKDTVTSKNPVKMQEHTVVESCKIK